MSRRPWRLPREGLPRKSTPHNRLNEQSSEKERTFRNEYLNKTFFRETYALIILSIHPFFSRSFKFSVRLCGRTLNVMIVMISLFFPVEWLREEQLWQSSLSALHPS